MSLRVIQGPPNAGRAGRVRQSMSERLDRGPILVVPNADDVYSFERELCAGGAVLGAAVMTFRGLFAAVAAAGGSPPAPSLSPAQRLGAVAAAAADPSAGLGPLRASARQPGFPRALERLLSELQDAGREPADVEAAAGSLEGSAYLADVSSLFSAYAALRDGLGRTDDHAIERDAVRLLADGGDWWRRPVFVYGFDDLSGNQLDLLRELRAVAEVTVAVPCETGNEVLEARVAPLLEALEEIGVDETESLPPDPGNTPDAPLLFHLERSFGREDPPHMARDESLVFLRSAGERGEAEAIATETARLLAAGASAEEIAIVVRDPGRRGPLIASVLESYGVPVALEAQVPVASTAVGSALVALLEALSSGGRAEHLLRYLRGPSGASRSRVDWFERDVRRRTVRGAGEALRLWERRYEEPPPGVAELRAATGDPAAMSALVAEAATAMGAMAGSELEARAAAAIATALGERAALPGLAPAADEIVAALRSLDVRVWRGPVEDRVRITDPRRVRAARFDWVFVASLQDGEFPAGGETDPFLSRGQRQDLGLRPLREAEVEERYLFHACLALPRRRLFLSHRVSDENGAAEAPSPLLGEVERLLEPPEAKPRGRELAEVVHAVAEAPSATELARAVAAHGPGAEVEALLDAASPGAEDRAGVAARLLAARGAELATRAPGPLSNPAVLESLAAVPAYGGTTLEGFDVCSYRWFVSHELAPQPLDPPPDPLVQGGIAHEVLQRLYEDPPGRGRLPRGDSLDAWRRRARELVAEVAEGRHLGGGLPAERSMLRRVEGWIMRFLGEESVRDAAGFEPWLLEAAFSESEDASHPPLEIDGWHLHGAIDRVDRDREGRALVIDYKLSGSVTARNKLEEEAKLQLQLYMLAARELWEADAVGGLYHPLRGTSERRPRGVVLEDVAEELASYGIFSTDTVDEAGLEELLDDARRRATTIVGRMRNGEIDRDPGPRAGLRGHGECPRYCEYAPICRRDRAPVEPADEDDEEEASG